jgi:TPR repeat protein
VALTSFYQEREIAMLMQESTMPRETPGAEHLFKLGMMCSTGQSMPLDMVSAHKWFNIAASLGIKDAVRLRNEVAAEMSDSEIATAQRAARDWLTRH